MKVIDLIHSNKKTAFSFEILPPLKGTGMEKLYQPIDTLREFDPKSPPTAANTCIKTSVTDCFKETA